LLNHRATHYLLEVLAALLVGLGLLIAVAAWRLSQGPVSVGFLKPYVEDALSAETGQVRVSFEDTVLAWAGWDRRLDVRATGVRAVNAAGEVIAQAPEAALSFSMSALLHGIVAPQTLDLYAPQATVVREFDGRYHLALGPPGAATGNAFGGLVAALLAPPDASHGLGYLRRVSILGARLDVEDRGFGVSWSAPRADLVFRKDARGIVLDAALDVDLAGRIARIEAIGAYDPDLDTVGVEARFRDLSPALLAEKFPILKPIAAVTAPMGGRVSLTLAADGALTSLGFDVSGAGGRIDLPDLWPKGLDTRSIRAKGRFQRGPDRLAIDELAVDLDGPRMGFEGTATRVGDSFAVHGALSARDIPVDSFDAYWPKGFGAGARKWITANLERGRLAEARADFALRLPTAGDADASLESLAGTFRFDGLSVHFLRPVPAVAAVRGTGVFDANRVDIAVSGGALGGLSVDQGTVRFAGLSEAQTQADVELVVRGPLRDALTVLDHDRLRLLRRFGIDPTAAEGRSATRLVLGFPVIDALKLEDMKIKAAANLDNVVLPKVAFGHDLADGTLVLRVDSDGLDLSGQAKLSGVPAEVVWAEDFTAKKEVQRRYQVKARLDAPTRARLGVDASPYLAGTIGVALDYARAPKGAEEVRVRLGLEDAALALGEFAWAKPPGVPGEATALFALSGGKLREVSGFSIEAGGLSANGRLEFAPDGRTLQRADLPRFAAGRTDLKATLVRREDGGYALALAGAGLDAKALARGERDPESGEFDLPPVSVTARFDRLWFTDDVPLSGVAGSFRRDEQGWREVSVDATLATGKPIALRIAPEGEGGRLGLESDDAGEALRAFGIYDNVRGGRLNLTGARPGAQGTPWAGRLSITEFRAIKAPALAKLLTVASLTGIGNLLAGEGIAFARLDMPYRLEDQRITFEKARAVGSEIGLTGEGEIDLAGETVKANGTIVPAYTINSVLGNIPVLGTLLTGGEGGGIFAATFRMEGPLEDPSVSVNPLAALAPGFLRNLVDGIMSGGATPTGPPAELENWRDPSLQ
jgi:hypothetical protein